MGGGGVIIILRKVVKDALQVGVSTSGKWKLWHVLLATHSAAALVGALIW